MHRNTRIYFRIKRLQHLLALKSSSASVALNGRIRALLRSIEKLKYPKPRHLQTIISNTPRSFDRELRLFACWSARETGLSVPLYNTLVDLSERFANGEENIAALRQKFKDAAPQAATATTIGINRQRSVAASYLACFQTLREDAKEAAEITAEMHRLWAELEALKHPNLLPEEASRLTLRAQMVKLFEILGSQK